MKLVLKLPQNKPPFIGIEFDSHYEASKTNSDIIGALDSRYYKINLRPINKFNIYLILECKDLMIKRRYQNLEYEQEKLKTWLGMTRAQKSFNFGHVIKEHNRHILVKAQYSGLNFVIKLEEVKLLEES